MAQAVTEPKLGEFSEALSAVAPQLYKRGRRTLSQAYLPDCDMFTFFLGKHPVSFVGSEQVFAALVHKTEYPNKTDLKRCRRFSHELAWYCSRRAVV